VGAQGKCRLRVKIQQLGTLAGKEVNEVHYFYRPKLLKEQPSISPEHYAAITKQAQTKAGKSEDQDNIPF
jgi:hypothetical protein